MPEKINFCSQLNMEVITDADYTHTKKTFKNCEKNLEEYHDLFVPNDTLIPADIFKNFWNKCLEIYGLDSAHFLSAPRLGWQATSK